MLISDWSSDVCSSDLNQSRKRISVLVSRATDEGSRSFAVAARSGAGASISSADLYGRLAHSISKPQKHSQPPWTAHRARSCAGSFTSTLGFLYGEEREKV